MSEKSIRVYNRDAETGKISPQQYGFTKCEAEPGVLFPSPDRRYLFVAMRSSGKLASYRIGPKRHLFRISLVEGGADPCYLFTDRTGRYLLTAYYVANQITVHAINEKGELSANPIQVIPTAEKAHAIHLDSVDQFAFAPHTGGNQIRQFRFDPRSGPLIPTSPNATKLSPGDQPRHVAIHPNGNWVYSNNEAGDSLNAFKLDRNTGQLTRVQKLTTLREGFDPTKNTTARCEMTPNGKFVYVANRGSNTIAAFEIDKRSGELAPRGIYDTEDTPRSLTVTPDGRFVYAAGQGNGFLQLYRIESNGALKSVERFKVGDTPWCVLAVDCPYR